MLRERRHPLQRAARALASLFEPMPPILYCARCGNPLFGDRTAEYVNGGGPGRRVRSYDACYGYVPHPDGPHCTIVRRAWQ